MTLHCSVSRDQAEALALALAWMGGSITADIFIGLKQDATKQTKDETFIHKVHS